MKALVRTVSPFVFLFSALFVMSHFKHQEELSQKEAIQIKSYISSISKETADSTLSFASSAEKQDVQIDPQNNGDIPAENAVANNQTID